MESDTIFSSTKVRFAKKLAFSSPSVINTNDYLTMFNPEYINK